MFECIFDLCNHGRGFTYEQVYRMPIYLRNFNLQRLVKSKEAEKGEAEKAQNSKSGKIVRKPPHVKR